jgi:hypothetical protein
MKLNFIVLGSFIIAIIAAFLTYASVDVMGETVSVTGVAGRGKYGGQPGYLSIILAAIAFGLTFINKKWAFIIVAVFGLLALGWEYVVYTKDAKCESVGELEICAKIGIGHYLQLLAALGIIVGGVLGFMKAGKPAA